MNGALSLCLTQAYWADQTYLKETERGYFLTTMLASASFLYFSGGMEYPIQARIGCERMKSILVYQLAS